MKLKVLIALFLAGNMALTSVAQAQFQMGMGAAGLMCPWGWGGAGGASSELDEIDELNNERRELRTEKREIARQIREMERDLERSRTAINEVLKPHWAGVIINHMDLGYNCSSCGPARPPRGGGDEERDGERTEEDDQGGNRTPPNPEQRPPIQVEQLPPIQQPAPPPPPGPGPAPVCGPNADAILNDPQGPNPRWECRPRTAPGPVTPPPQPQPQGRPPAPTSCPPDTAPEWANEGTPQAAWICREQTPQPPPRQEPPRQEPPRQEPPSNPRDQACWPQQADPSSTESARNPTTGECCPPRQFWNARRQQCWRTPNSSLDNLAPFRGIASVGEQNSTPSRAPASVGRAPASARGREAVGAGAAVRGGGGGWDGENEGEAVASDSAGGGLCYQRGTEPYPAQYPEGRPSWNAICRADGFINSTACTNPRYQNGSARSGQAGSCARNLDRYRRMVKERDRLQNRLSAVEDEISSLGFQIGDLRREARRDRDLEAGCPSGDCYGRGSARGGRRSSGGLSQWIPAIGGLVLGGLAEYAGYRMNRSNNQILANTGYPTMPYQAGGYGFPYAMAGLYGSMNGGVNGGFGCSGGLGGTGFPFGPMGMMNPLAMMMMGGGLGGGMFNPGMGPWGLNGMGGFPGGIGGGLMGGYPGMMMGGLAGGYPGMMMGGLAGGGLAGGLVGGIAGGIAGGYPGMMMGGLAGGYPGMMMGGLAGGGLAGGFVGGLAGGIAGGYPGMMMGGLAGGYPGMMMGGLAGGGLAGGFVGGIAGGIAGGYPGMMMGGLAGGYPGMMMGGLAGGYPGMMMGGLAGGMGLMGGGLAGMVGGMDSQVMIEMQRRQLDNAQAQMQMRSGIMQEYSSLMMRMQQLNYGSMYGLGTSGLGLGLGIGGGTSLGIGTGLGSGPSTIGIPGLSR